MKSILSYLLLLTCLGLSAQTTITGFIDLEYIETSTKIHLSQISLDAMSDNALSRDIATTSVDKNGFFKFKEDVIPDTDAIYQIHLKRFEKALKDTLQVEQLFLLSEGDSIHFKKSKIPFTKYVNTNLADKEWRKLRRFERKLRKTDFKKEDSLSDVYLTNMKTYAKDSLEILMVKLIGIKQLDNKDLLEKDIAKNPEYYVALLEELKESEIERSEYLFLENKLAFLTTEIVENKYTTSKVINILLGLVVVGLVLFLVRLQRKKKLHVFAELSRQEKNIQGLILQGKSNKEIANELFISLNTVKSHITNIYSKLKVSNRQELLQKSQNP